MITVELCTWHDSSAFVACEQFCCDMATYNRVTLKLIFHWIWITMAKNRSSWWRHQMETFSALLALFVGNSPVTGEFPSHRPVTRNFDIFFDLRLNKRLRKQSRRRWFQTHSRSFWSHYNGELGPSRPSQWWYSDRSHKLSHDDIWRHRSRSTLA